MVELHHDRIHRAHVDAANAAIEELILARRRDDFAHLAELERALAFHASGHVLHSMLWLNLSPHGGGRPDGELAEAIERDFGGYERFRKQLIHAAVTLYGPGWALLVFDPVTHRLGTTQVRGHHAQVTQGAIPLLALDAWEHAYQSQYRTDVVQYCHEMFELWSWDDVWARYVRVKELDLALADASEERVPAKAPSLEPSSGLEAE